jgi:hypothetical protein
MNAAILVIEGESIFELLAISPNDGTQNAERRTEERGAEDNDDNAPDALRKAADGVTSLEEIPRVRQDCRNERLRYQAIEANGTAVKGVIEAEDRKGALQLLGKRGLFPSSLEICSVAAAGNGAAPAPVLQAKQTPASDFHFGTRIRRKEITAFTREMGALLGAGIPIPQALDGLGEEEENPALKEMVLKLCDSVRKGVALSAALEEQPRLFSKLYVSMVG